VVKRDLNDVRTFVAAAEAGTLSAAAKELNVPTSTVSRSLTRLERNLGLLLINRSSKGFVLTDAGSEYLRSCRFALQALRDGDELLEKHRNNPSGMIRALCPGTMARHLLTPIIAKFVVANAALTINLETYSPRFDPGSRMDVDVIFTVNSPNDSSRRVRSYPGTARGLFASPQYVREYGLPNKPKELLHHRCIGIF
jgi:LysR family transcriptional regulator, transcriptional activator for dmlA